jgi:hypothetical protein
MIQDVKKAFNGFVKICDALNKITDEKIIASNGVFLWRVEGALSITTFQQKFEKDILPFLCGKYVLNVSAVLFMSKYFQIEDIKFDHEGIRFFFSGTVSAEALNDKQVENVLTIIDTDKSTGQYILSVNWMQPDNLDFIQISGILRKIDSTADFSKSVVIDDLDKAELMKGSKPLTINQGGFHVRIAKSVFQSINANDSITLRCTPYHNIDSIFLCTATVSKDHCQVINVFNALHI